MEKADTKKTLQILLVEDSPSDAALLQESILSSGARDIRVSVAQSLNEALVHLENNHTDAVLLDLTLPDSSGLDTVLRAKLACSNLPIIVLTGVDDEETGIAAMRMGVQDYLVKGQADGRTIMRAIHYAVERKRAEQALRQARDELELRVQERTKELSKLNVELTAEIAERKQAQERTRITNVLLELFAQKTTRKEYLDSVVKAIRDWSGCRCVGVRLVDSNGFIPYESCVGFSEQFLAKENMISLKSDACSCIRVVTQKPESQDKPVTTPRGSFRCDNAIDFINKLTREKKSRYRGNCVRNGFASLAIVPVRYRQEILGAIHLADEKEGKVPPETVEFLENMAMLIGEAVHRFNQEQELKLSQQQLRLLTSQLSLVERSRRGS
jgi:DNA-binding response OmpR family regulator